jgi:hypothetical protein
LAVWIFVLENYEVLKICQIIMVLGLFKFYEEFGGFVREKV